MPPFGNLYGLPTYVDQRLAKEDYIVFEAGTYTEAIKLCYRDYERGIDGPQYAARRRKAGFDSAAAHDIVFAQ